MADIPMEMIGEILSHLPVKEMVDFPMEMIGEILSHLPLKIILRFSCVSKRWHALINSYGFLKTNFNQAKSSSKLLFGDAGSLFHIDIDLLGQEPPLSVKPVYPLHYYSNYCNGLVVVYSYFNVSLIILNPFTRKFRALPLLPLNPLGYITYWLGYDSVNDDYKVLRSTYTSEVNLYSLKSNSWKVIMDCPGHGIFVHGALHSLDEKGRQRKIIGFDFASEERYEIALPEGLHTISLFAFQGSLGAYCLDDVATLLKDSAIDLWMITENRVEKSWVKLFTVTPPFNPLHSHDVFPVSYSNNGRELLLIVNDGFVWLDLESKTCNRVDLKGLLFIRNLRAELCVETLISPDGYGVGGENDVNRRWINLASMLDGVHPMIIQTAAEE